MSLLGEQNTNGTLPFPKSLTTEYQPQTLAEFCGLEKQKRILTNLAASLRECGLVFEGGPGTGKTSMAFVFARMIKGEIHHVTSQECKLENLQSVSAMCHRVAYDFATGEARDWHVVIVDEADKMSSAAQDYMLSKLDGTATCPRTVWIFTCNQTEPFQDRFLSRCIRLPKFHSVGAGKDVKALLTRIWKDKANGTESPDFDKAPTSNVRESLQWLECELLAA
jgi:replication-associated recombination protein RarA